MQTTTYNKQDDDGDDEQEIIYIYTLYINKDHV